MYFFPDAELEAILSEDVPYGDLTSRLLGLEKAEGAVECFFREEGVLAGAELAERLFRKAGLTVTRTAQDGDVLSAKTVFLRAEGRADRIHAVYKVAQNVMEYASGIATRTRAMVEAAQKRQPRLPRRDDPQAFPGDEAPFASPVEAGGRASCTARGLFGNRFPGSFDSTAFFSPDFAERLKTLRRLDPERKVAVEVADVEEGVRAADLGADILQCDKMTPQDVAVLVARAKASHSGLIVSAAGGVNAGNAADYARAGADFLVTSWPYFGRPHDVKMRMSASPDTQP